MGRHYTCANCGNEYESGWTEAEAEAEAKANWGALAEKDREVVCDDCYRKFMGWYEGLSPSEKEVMNAERSEAGEF